MRQHALFVAMLVTYLSVVSLQALQVIASSRELEECRTQYRSDIVYAKTAYDRAIEDSGRCRAVLEQCCE